jgi:integrase
VIDLAWPPAAVAKPATEIDPTVWEAVVLDLTEREPISAMAVLLAGVTGARLGELCGLRWTDIDPERRLLTISRSIQHGLDKTTLSTNPA